MLCVALKRATCGARLNDAQQWGTYLQIMDEGQVVVVDYAAILLKPVHVGFSLRACGASCAAKQQHRDEVGAVLLG